MAVVIVKGGPDDGGGAADRDGDAEPVVSRAERTDGRVRPPRLTFPLLASRTIG